MRVKPLNGLPAAVRPVFAARNVRVNTFRNLSSLEKHKVNHLGFVIFRCAYGSQEKWDKLLALVKQHTREHFEVREMPEVCEKMVWTVIEDPATLDDAGIDKTTNRFCEWVWSDEGRREHEGRRDEITGLCDYCRRCF
ncbi:hypothetical protein VTI74DRAFT_3481 [Chaetomium olivicolor]